MAPNCIVTPTTALGMTCRSDPSRGIRLFHTAWCLLAVVLLVTACGDVPNPTTHQSLQLGLVDMTSSSQGWGVDALGEVVITTDGGNEWKVRSSTPLTSLMSPFAKRAIRGATPLPNQNVSLALSGPDMAQIAFLLPSGVVNVFSTDDGGPRWTQSRFSPAKGTTGVASNSDGWLVTWVDGLAGNAEMTVWRSHTGGWSSRPSSTVPFSITGAAVIGSTVFVTGAAMAFDRAFVDVSKNGGSTWSLSTLRIPSGNYAVTTYPPVVSGRNVVVPIIMDNPATNRGGYFLTATRDPVSGHWQSSARESLPPAPKPSPPLMSFVDAIHGWVIVNASEGFRTSSGGMRWTRWSLPTGATISLQFVTPRVGFVLTSHAGKSTLQRSTDGGLTFRPIAHSTR